MKRQSKLENKKDNKPEVVFLKGKKTVLRPPREDDLEIFVRWFNDPEIRRYISNHLPMSESREHEWLSSLHKKLHTDIVLVIEVKGLAIGTIGIHQIDWHNRTATTGAVIGEKNYWGRGYGTDAKMVLLEYAFDTLGLRKIISRVKAFNERSLAYSLHCGYKVEGRLRLQHFVGGKYHDEVVLGLFREDWLPYWQKWQQKK